MRSFISVPAGVLRSPLARYTVLTLFGSLIWCFAFAGAGWALGDTWETFHSDFRYVDYVAVVVVLGFITAAAVHRRRTRVREA